MTSAPPGGTAVAVLACVIATAAVLCCAGRAVGLAGAAAGLLLTHGAVTVSLAAAGGFVGVAIMAVFSIMLADVLRQ